MTAYTVPCSVCNPPPPIGQGRTFEQFQPVQGTEAMVSAAITFATASGPNRLTIIGKHGCGKTHILEAIGTMMRQNRQTVGFIFVPDFLARLRSSFEPDSQWRFEDVWDRWAGVDVLLLDDLKDDGHPTAWAIEQIERVIVKRDREKKPYVVTTNGTLNSIGAVWGPRLADRLFDERSENVRVVYNTAASYRTGKLWK